jgi:hypothetical protein
MTESDRGDARPRLDAIRLDPSVVVPIVPASQARAWLAPPGPSFATRCLPMLIGSQGGWFLENPLRVEVTWNGGPDPDAITIVAGPEPHPLVSADSAGHGRVRWSAGYAFVTDPDWRLRVRGPANWPRRALAPLDQIFETGSADPVDPARIATASLPEIAILWQFTEPNQPVVFEAGHPFGMIVPIPAVAASDGVDIEIRPLSSDPELDRNFRLWGTRRGRHIKEMKVPGTRAADQEWQRHYFRGYRQSGEKFPEHQTRLHLAEFGNRCPVDHQAESGPVENGSDPG